MEKSGHLRYYVSELFFKEEMFQTEVVKKIKTHILCSVTFFFPENSAVFKIMWNTVVVADRPQMTIWRMRIAC